MLRGLDRYPRLRHWVYTAAHGLERGLARLGLDLNRRRISAGGAPAHPALRVAEYREGQFVPVTGPIARFDLEPGAFAGLCIHLANGYSRPSDGVITVDRGSFDLPSGLVAVDRRLLSDVIPLLYFPHPENLIPAARLLTRRPQEIPDGVLAHLCMSDSYYHWLAEILPRALALVERVDAALPLYLGRDLPGFGPDSLTLLGLGQRVSALPAGVYTAQHLHVSTFRRAEWPVVSDIWSVRERLLEAVGVSAQSAGRRLLISRTDARERRVLNEQELVDAFDLEPVTLSHLTLAQQIELFSQAELIVGPHGAGLTNTMFAPTNCRLVELTLESHFSPSYLLIASLLKQPYGYVSGYQAGRDMRVDVSGLGAVLRELG